MPVTAIGAEMPWDEATRLAVHLRNDPSSAIAAACEGWEYSFSRLEAIMADLWDLEHAKAGPKKSVRYPRPVPEQKAQTRRGNAAGRTPEEVKRLLREQFGQIEAPV